MNAARRARQKANRAAKVAGRPPAIQGASSALSAADEHLSATAEPRIVTAEELKYAPVNYFVAAWSRQQADAQKTRRRRLLPRRRSR